MVEEVLSQLKGVLRVDGTPLVKTLVGSTPVNNRSAIIFLKMAGFKVQFTLKEATYIKAEDKYVDNLISTYEL
jgi:hypothetical protein